MSDEFEADDRRAAEPQDAQASGRTEHPGCVIASSFGLLAIAALLAGLVGLVLFAKGSDFDGEERVEDVFVGGVAPFGLEVTRATRMPQGDTVVELGVAGAGAAAREGGVVPPNELVLYEAPTAATVLAKFDGPKKPQGFGGGGDEMSPRAISAKVVEWEKDPKEAWHATIASGEVAWSKWKAAYRTERAFREDGTWRDSVRVNLVQSPNEERGLPGRNLVLFAQWPKGVAADEAAIRDVLRTIRMIG